MKLSGMVAGVAVGTVLTFGTVAGAEYVGGPVSNGGTLSGKVVFKGDVPAPKTFAFEKFPNSGFCSQTDSDGKGNRVVHEVKVGKDNGLKDVVVYVEGIEKGKAFDFNGTDVKIDGCRFSVQGGPSTYAGVVVNKADIRVLNTDADPTDPKAATGVLHNPHSYEVAGNRNSTVFNLPLPEKGQTLTKPVKLRKKESTFMIECDQHNYMQAFFVPVDNPYYAVVGDDGTFSIGDIPPGTYEVYAWHPKLGKQEMNVTIESKGQAQANFAFAAN